MTNDRRNPHRPFDPALLGEFLRGRQVVSVALLTDGKINSNYKVALSDGGTYVARLYSHGDPARERCVMDIAREVVTVPLVFAHGDDWSVFEFLDGVSLESAPHHAGAAAEALARIGSIAFERTGWIEADGSISPFPFSEEGGFITHILSHGDVQAWIGQDTVDEIKAIMEKETTRRSEIDDQPRLVHGDFNPSNILIDNGRVSGILDWEFSHSNTPYMDIGNLLRNTDELHREDIRSGLESGGMRVPEDWQERAELVDLGSHLESLTSRRSDEFKRLCVARIERFVEKFG